jgi:hypothetical protein
MASVVEILEATYSLEHDDDQAWLADLVRAAMPHLDEGLGAFGYHFDMRRPAGRWLDPPVFLGRSAALAQTGLALLSAGHDMLSDEQRAQIYVQRTPRVLTEW